MLTIALKKGAYTGQRSDIATGYDIKGVYEGRSEMSNSQIWVCADVHVRQNPAESELCGGPSLDHHNTLS
jgi:hypothetical protein